MALSKAQARYQNALLYGPGRSVGNYPGRGPEQSAAMLPIPSTPPTVFQPSPSSGVPAGGGYTNALVGLGGPPIGSAAGAAGLGGLAAPLTAVALKALQAALKPKDGGEKKPEAAPDEGTLGGDPKNFGADPYSDLKKPEAAVFEGTMGGDPKNFGADPYSDLNKPEAAVFEGTMGGDPKNFGADPYSGDMGFDQGADGLFGGGGSDPVMAGADGASGLEGAGADAASKFGADAPAGFSGFSDPSSFDLGGFTINPLNIAGSFAGNWAGNKLLDGSGQEGDPDDRWMRSVGGSIGAAIGSLLPIPFLGTAFGSMMGTIAGSAFEGEPDVPYSYAWGGGNYNFNNPDAAPTFSMGGYGAENNGNAAAAGNISNALGQYLGGRAQNEGYVWNPEKVNQGGFYTGIWGGNNAGSNKQMFYQPYYDRLGGAAVLRDGRDEPDQLFNNFDDLKNYAWGSLTGENYFTRPGSTASWGDVLGNLNSTGGAARNTFAAYSTESGNNSQTTMTAPVEQRTYDPAAYWYGNPGYFQQQATKNGGTGYNGFLNGGGDGGDNYGFIAGNPYDTPDMIDGRGTAQNTETSSG